MGSQPNMNPVHHPPAPLFFFFTIPAINPSHKSLPAIEAVWGKEVARRWSKLVLFVRRVCARVGRAADNWPRFLTNCHGNGGWQTGHGVGETAESVGKGWDVKYEQGRRLSRSYYVKCGKQKQKITSEQRARTPEGSPWHCNWRQRPGTHCRLKKCNTLGEGLVLFYAYLRLYNKQSVCLRCDIPTLILLMQF